MCRAIWLVGLIVALAGCNAIVPSATPSSFSRAVGRATSSSKIQHVVIIFQENRSVDDLFNGFPGADTVRYGRNSRGQKVALRPIGWTEPYDLSHTHPGFEVEYDGGKLDGWDKEGSRCYNVGYCIPSGLRAYGYVPRAQSKPYWDMASQYVLADKMFQTNQGPSFPAHQYIVSGTSTVANGSSFRASENPYDPSGFNNGGCDSPSSALVPLIDSSGNEDTFVYPCFNRISLMQLVERKGLSWHYYQAASGPGIWNGPDAVLSIRKSPKYSSNVVTPAPRVLEDIAQGRLANVVWVTPAAIWSDHAHSTNGAGPSWVAAVVNAIGESQYWNNTAILVTWDDWGGWYDHVSPPVYNSYELGFRVPLIVISPYAKARYVSHVQHEFGSLLKFTEETFALGSLHTTDQRSDDLADCFDFQQSPRTFRRIPAPFPAKYFLHNPRANEPPDDDASYASIYSFGQQGKADDGSTPSAHLIDVSGRLFGTAKSGGTTNAGCPSGCGALYDVSTAGKERVLYRFQGGTDGAGPTASLTSLGGALYGTTSAGGSNNCSGGCGTIFKTALNGSSETLVYRFAGGADGAAPMAGLEPIAGALYGTTELGGYATTLCAQGCGTIFSVSASGTEKVLHAFKGGSDGAQPVGGLISSGGALYGTTEYGGARTVFCTIGCGTVFKIDPNTGAYTVLHEFEYGPNDSDGAYPGARLLVVNGALYGTTLGGGSHSNGTVFKISGTSESVVHSFNCCKAGLDGSYPYAGLIALGSVLYGTTRQGGPNKHGTVFSITTGGSESVLYSFSGQPDGAVPVASLFALDGTLYGTTATGGSTTEGTIFKITP